jgi:ATP-dependent helicase/nuclease subunit B
LRFLDADTSYRNKYGMRPLAAELEFGFPRAGLGTVALDLPDGRTVSFRGFADRVDVADDGSLHVLDYKTGKADPYKGLSEENPDAQGQMLQLAVYGQAARQLHGTVETPVRAEYWFVSARGQFKRIGYSVTPAVLAHIGETLQSMVNGIEAGVFPTHPTAQSTSIRVECPYCDPDGMGVAELRRQYEHKQADEAMDAFVNFVQPLEDIDVDTDIGQLIND